MSEQKIETNKINKNKLPESCLPICRICKETLGITSTLKVDFINKSNPDVNTIVLKCSEDHTQFIDIPLNKIHKYLRRFKHKFENRQNSWRNKVFTLLHLCVCTNSYHTHRAGIHAFGHKDKWRNEALCDKCRNILDNQN